MADPESADADDALKQLIEDNTIGMQKPSCLTGLTNIVANYYNCYVHPLIDIDFTYKGEEWETPYDALSELEYVGAGAFGKVYSAKLRGEVVAVKIPEDKRETDMLYLRELRHENIVRFRGVCSKGPNYCIIMEFCQYGSLYNFLHSGTRVLITRTLTWAREISLAMAYLHSRNIIHRDLKSPNVLIADNLVCKVSDFGTSRKWEKLSLVMSTRGTTYWMAPEMMLGKKCSDKVDVWSYGVVLWELLTQEVPYEDLHPCVVTYGVGKEKLSLPVPSTFPLHLRILLNHCWKRQPKSRPSFARISEILAHAHVEYSWLRDDMYNTMQDSWKQEVQKIKKNGWHSLPVSPEPVVEQPPRQTNLLHKKIMREATKMYMDACALYLRLEQREIAIAEREKANNISIANSRLSRRQMPSSSSSGLSAAQMTVVRLQHSVNHKVRTVTRLANMASLPDDVTRVHDRRRSRSTPNETKTNDVNGNFNSKDSEKRNFNSKHSEKKTEFNTNKIFETKLYTTETGIKTELNTNETGIKTELNTNENGIKTELNTKETGIKTELNTNENGIKTELNTKEIGLKAELNTNGTGVKTELTASRNDNANAVNDNYIEPVAV